MGQILRNWRVITATLFSVVLIVGAFILARGVESPPSAQASEETALLKAIATKDSDGDGLPDWEEALYGTDPHITDTMHLEITDGEAVAKGLIVPKAIADIPTATSSPVSLGDNGLPPPPARGTLTAAFTQEFFNLYLDAKQANGGGDLSDAQVNDVVNKAVGSLSATVKIAPSFKTLKDLTVSGSGATALVTFAEDAETVLKRETANATTSEINYLKRVLENGDTDALSRLSSIAKTYRDSAIGLAVLPVPTELAGADLEFINAMMHLSQIINDFTLVNTDPVTSMLALHQYAQAVQDLAQATLDIGNVFLAAHISVTPDTPGALLITRAEDFAKRQAALQKP